MNAKSQASLIEFMESPETTPEGLFFQELHKAPSFLLKVLSPCCANVLQGNVLSLLPAAGVQGAGAPASLARTGFLRIMQGKEVVDSGPCPMCHLLALCQVGIELTTTLFPGREEGSPTFQLPAIWCSAAARAVRNLQLFHRSCTETEDRGIHVSELLPVPTLSERGVN